MGKWLTNYHYSTTEVDADMLTKILTLSGKQCQIVWLCLEKGIIFRGQMNKGRPKRRWEKQVEEESVIVGLRREDELC